MCSLKITRAQSKPRIPRRSATPPPTPQGTGHRPPRSMETPRRGRWDGERGRSALTRRARPHCRACARRLAEERSGDPAPRPTDPRTEEVPVLRDEPLQRLREQGLHVRLPPERRVAPVVPGEARLLPVMPEVGGVVRRDQAVGGGGEQIATLAG